MPDQLEDLLLQRPATPEHPSVTAALKLLAGKFKPTVPVKTYDDPDKLFEEVLKRFGPTKLSKDAVGVVPLDNSAIYINSRSKEFRSPYQLASKLAHEQVHAVQPVWGKRETPAYEQEVEFINTTPTSFESTYRDLMRAQLEKVRKAEQKLPPIRTPPPAGYVSQK
jgi:hypothetical protein